MEVTIDKEKLRSDFSELVSCSSLPRYLDLFDVFLEYLFKGNL